MALPRERDRKLALGEDITLTIRTHAKHLSLSLFFQHTYGICGKMRSARGMIMETFGFLDPVKCLFFKDKNSVILL